MSYPKPQIYIIEGCIGTGKSTLIESTLKYGELIFGQFAQIVVIREAIYTPFLDMYLKNKKTMAFPFQVCMARDRIEAMRMAQRHYRKGRIVLVDRGIPGDIAFAKLHQKAGNIGASRRKPTARALKLPKHRCVQTRVLPATASTVRLKISTNRRASSREA